MAKRDYYEVLGVARDADLAEIKKAFRRLARENHPDVNKDDPEATERFKEIGEAYAVLSDPEKRAQYDRYGHEAPVGLGLDWGQGMDFGLFGDLGSLFESFFRGPFRQSRPESRGPERGDDLRFDLEITLEEAAFGVEKELEVPRLQTCPSCFGQGTAPGTSPATCSACGGRGQVQRSQRTIFGYTMIQTVCHRCGGEGQVIKDPCAECRGAGRVRRTRQITVTIPPGVETGQRLRVAGEGDVGLRGGPEGDLYVFLHVRPHEHFQREGRHLACEVELSFPQAALGDTIEVPGLDGPKPLTIRPGTQNGDSYTLRGEGMPDVQTGIRGDLHVLVKVVTPTNLTAEQKELLYEFARAGGQKLKPPEPGWMNRIKQALGG